MKKPVKKVAKRKAMKVIPISATGKGKSYSTKRVLEGKDKVELPPAKERVTFVEYGKCMKFPTPELAMEWLKKQPNKKIWKTKAVKSANVLGGESICVFVAKTTKDIKEGIARSQAIVGIGRMFIGALFNSFAIVAVHNSLTSKKKSPKKAVKKSTSKKK